MTGTNTSAPTAPAPEPWTADGSSLDWFHHDLSDAASDVGGELHHACVFELGGTTYALDVAVVSEVFTPDLLTPVPLAPTGFLGLCNLRGTALAIADFATVLGTTNARARSDGMQPVLVLRFPELSVGVTIDRVIEIRGYRESDIVPTQSNRSEDPVRGYLQRDADAQKLTTMLRSEFVRARLEALRLRRERDLTAAD